MGQIDVATSAGPRSVAGWVWKHFGLDFRAIWYPDDFAASAAGWCLTHRSSGLSVINLMMDFASACRIAEEIDGWADWGRVDPSSARFLRSRAVALRQRLGPRAVKIDDMMPPWFVDAIDAAPGGAE